MANLSGLTLKFGRYILNQLFYNILIYIYIGTFQKNIGNLIFISHSQAAYISKYT